MKIMAIDYGDAHTGVAISDRTLTLTGFSTVITAYRPEAVIEKLLPLISEHEVTELVLGHPLNMDGTRGPRAEKAEGFAEMLREATSLPVTLWDERRTTVDAHNILLNNGKRAKERKKTVDAVAASLMLEGYLTFKNRQGYHITARQRCTLFPCAAQGSGTKGPFSFAKENGPFETPGERLLIGSLRLE